MATAPKKLKHADGTEVTAQEAYDAFMNTRVLIIQGETTYEAVRMKWYDNNSGHNDPNNVGFVNIGYVGLNPSGVISLLFVTVGNPSLAPGEQG